MDSDLHVQYICDQDAKSQFSQKGMVDVLVSNDEPMFRAFRSGVWGTDGAAGVAPGAVVECRSESWRSVRRRGRWHVRVLV